MAYDEHLADRVRALLDDESTAVEKKMFGGLGFMVDGHLAVSVGSDSMLVRADAASASQWMGGHVTQAHMGEREMLGWLDVAAPALASDSDLELWVGRGVTYVRSLPPKS